jgi:hypothetical protein
MATAFANRASMGVVSSILDDSCVNRELSTRSSVFQGLTLSTTICFYLFPMPGNNIGYVSTLVALRHSFATSVQFRRRLTTIPHTHTHTHKRQRSFYKLSAICVVPSWYCMFVITMCRVCFFLHVLVCACCYDVLVVLDQCVAMCWKASYFTIMF